MIENNLNNNKNLCQCGCNQEIPLLGLNGKPRRYVKNHHYNGKSGNKSAGWKGRVCFNGQGYLMIYKPDHKFATQSGYYRLHRFVYEYFNKCCLLPWIEIHHVNGIRTDNHKDNLMALYKSKHMSITNLKNMDNRICYLCKSNKTSIRKINNRPLWFRYKDGFICVKCCYKNYYNKKIVRTDT